MTDLERMRIYGLRELNELVREEVRGLQNITNRIKTSLIHGDDLSLRVEFTHAFHSFDNIEHLLDLMNKFSED